MMRGILIVLCFTALRGAEPERILIAFHSETGNTAALAEAVREGAARAGGDCSLGEQAFGPVIPAARR